MEENMIKNNYYSVVEEPTILEIIDEIIKGTISEGTTFKYDGKEWIYDGEDIRTVEADYYCADVKEFLYLVDYIDLPEFGNKVSDFSRVYKSVISTSVYNQDKPINWCASVYRGNSRVHCCPVCGGNGIVSNGFYNHTGNTWISSTTAPEQCRSCSGKGYVVVND